MCCNVGSHVGAWGHVSQLVPSRGIPKNIPFPWARTGTQTRCHDVKLPWLWQRAIAAHSCHPPGSATPILAQSPWLGQRPALLIPACPCGVWQLGKTILFWEKPQVPLSLLQPSAAAISSRPRHVPARCLHCHPPSPPQSCPLSSSCPLPRVPSLSGCPAVAASAAPRCVGAAGPMRASAGSLAML